MGDMRTAEQRWVESVAVAVAVAVAVLTENGEGGRDGIKGKGTN